VIAVSPSGLFSLRAAQQFALTPSFATFYVPNWTPSPSRHRSFFITFLWTFLLLSRAFFSTKRFRFSPPHLSMQSSPLLVGKWSSSSPRVSSDPIRRRKLPPPLDSPLLPPELCCAHQPPPRAESYTLFLGSQPYATPPSIPRKMLPLAPHFPPPSRAHSHSLFSRSRLRKCFFVFFFFFESDCAFSFSSPEDSISFFLLAFFVPISLHVVQSCCLPLFLDF